MRRTAELPIRVVEGNAVGAYATVRGAMLAVDHLRSSGIDVKDVAVRPRSLSLHDHALDAVADEPGVRRAIAGGVVADLLALVLLGPSLGAVLLAALVGTLVGVLVLAVDIAQLTVRRRRRDRRSNLVRADKFEIVCPAQNAEHLLAAWWDPKAPPATRKAVDRLSAAASNPTATPRDGDRRRRSPREGDSHFRRSRRLSAAPALVDDAP
jgi:hypothetical protein